MMCRINMPSGWKRQGTREARGNRVDHRMEGGQGKQQHPRRRE